jgi:hypothetical protein
VTREGGGQRRGEPVPGTPDLTDRILHEVARRRPFMSRRARRAVWMGRLGVCAAMALGLTAIVGAQRAWPERTTLVPSPRPFAAAVEAARAEAGVACAAISEVVGVLSSPEPGLASLAPGMIERPEGSRLARSTSLRADPQAVRALATRCAGASARSEAVLACGGAAGADWLSVPLGYTPPGAMGAARVAAADIFAMPPRAAHIALSPLLPVRESTVP